MAETIPPILIKLAADVSDLKTGLAQAQSSLKGLDSTVKSTSSGMGSFVSKLKSVGAAMGVAFAGQQIASFAKSAVLAASDMNESLSKVQVVFGQGSGAVVKFADDAAVSMGLSKQAALEAAGTYGNLFQAFGLGQKPAQDMSTSLVQLASDLASFNNTSTDEALLALRSGLSGETEPLKKFGVALSDTRLKTEALAMGLIKSTSEALTPAAKAQASYALIMKDTVLAQGDYERTSSGTANTMRTLAAQIQNAKAALGAALLPAFQALLLIMKPVVAILAKFGKFLGDNAGAVKIFISVLLLGAAAWGAYTLAINAATIATKIWSAVTKANPIGLIITAVALLAAGIYTLWTKSEAFRKLVIDVGKAGVQAIGFIIRVVGDLVTAWLKLVTGPMRLFLKGMALLGNDAAKNALKTIDGAIQNTGDFFDAAAKKVESYGSALDKLNAKKSTNPVQNGSYLGGNGEKTPTGGVDPNAAKDAAAKEKKRLAELKADQKKLDGLYKQLANLEEKKAKLQADYDKNVADRRLKYDDDVLKAKEAANKKLIDLEKAYNKQVEQAQKAAADSRKSIIQQSIDNLRDVFRSASALDVGKMFADLLKGEDPTQATATTLVDKFKQQLADIKLLAANASALQSKGFSQTFVEQVVAQGTDVGNKLADEILKATPETVSQLQSLFTEIQDTSAHGVDVLGNTMYEKLGLATEELKKNYAQIGIDLNESLAQYAADFAEATAQVKADLVDALAELQKDLNKDLADMQDAFHVAMAEINKDIAAVIAQINTLLALMAQLGGLGKSGGSGGGSTKTSTKYNPLSSFNAGSFRLAEEKSNALTVNISANTNASAEDIRNSVINGYKYGSVVLSGSGAFDK
jgi:hypothetical protein